MFRLRTGNHKCGRGALICFEGIDGSGKSAVASEFSKRLYKVHDKVELVEKKDALFRDPYVAAHMGSLRRLIWEYQPDDPLDRLGDLHWLHLMVAWFATLNHAHVQPLVQAGSYVVVDNWYFKFLARFLAKKGAAESLEARAAFEGISMPDLVILLDVSPEVAASRKHAFTLAEAGVLDGLAGTNRMNFITYQTRVRGVLRDLAAELGWVTVDANRDLEAILEDVCALLR